MTIALSPHFTLAEMTVSQEAARRGIDNTPDMDNVDRLRKTCAGLEEVRALLGVPLIVSSGYRSPALNAAVGGSKSSQHMRGEAADFTAPQFGTVQAVCQAISDSAIEFDQLINEFGAWVHISFSDAPRRQRLVIDRMGTRPMP